LAVDGTNAKEIAREILEVKATRREYAEAPADVSKPLPAIRTLGILGAVLGLIHVMQSQRSIEVEH
jgi:flagellar motor component MotA